MKTQRTIRNCDFEFKFKCPKKWDELIASETDGARFCGECKKDVFYCSTDEETLKHAELGHCIARERPSDEELPFVLLGEPDAQTILLNKKREPAGKWDQREEGIDDALKNFNASTRQCTECGFPLPSWRKTCRICGFEIGREKNA